MSVPASLRASPCQTQMEIDFAGETLVLDACGALYVPAHEALIVADLHLEKGSFFAARGNPIPCYDTRETLRRLAEAVNCYQPRIVVSLGDSFHDTRAGERISASDADFLQSLVGSAREWVWVTGNHDPEIATRFAGRAAASFQLGGIILTHMPEDGAPPVIAGHYHPKHRFRSSVRSVSGPCFVIGTETVLMPAFGAYTGGLSASSEPIAALFADECRQHVLIYGDKLWALE